LKTRLADECQTNEENLKTKDEAISNLVSSKSDLEHAVAKKDVIIEDMKTQIDGLKKDNANLELDLKSSQALKDALLEEQNKTKETQSKVTELTEFILARDETISQLKVEATKSLEELKALEDNSTAEIASQTNEIESLKKTILDKVTLK